MIVRRLLMIGSVVALFGLAAQAAHADTYASSGVEETYTVPAGVGWIHVTAVGAQGGGASGGGCIGGRGSVVETTVPVSPGDMLFVNVGGAGDSHPRGAASGSAGGFNGGGDGGTAQPNASTGSVDAGGGGGGATDVRTLDSNQPGTLDSRLIVAGGGGGGGGGRVDCSGGDGGASPGSGASSATAVGGSAGAPAGDGAGGASLCGSGENGSPGTGGVGGSCAVSGGGGGGGYRGGGGGGGGDIAAGGGAGANLIPVSSIATTITTAPGGVLAPADGALEIVPTGPPVVSLAVPATVYQDDAVSTSFACGDGGFAPVNSCVDTDGASGQGLLHTSRLGTFTYTVTATNAHGLTASRSVDYTVILRPVGAVLPSAAGNVSTTSGPVPPKTFPPAPVTSAPTVPSLGLGIVAPTAVMRGGATLRLTFRTTNAGTGPAASLRICATLPAGASVVSVSGGGRVTGRRVCWSAPSLFPGSSAVQTVRARFDPVGRGIATMPLTSSVTSITTGTAVVRARRVVLVRVSDTPGG